MGEWDSGRRARIGLIGCGFYAQNHLHAWQDLAGHGADLVAVCDLDEAKACRGREVRREVVQGCAQHA